MMRTSRSHHCSGKTSPPFVPADIQDLRREWVFRKRIELVMSGNDLSTVVSFNDMLFRFWWIWDANRLSKLK